MNYYVIRQYSKGGIRQTPANYPYSTRAQAERQFNLLKAAAWKNEIDIEEPTMDIDFESIEIGTIEQGKIDRLYLKHNKPISETPEDESETETEE